MRSRALDARERGQRHLRPRRRARTRRGVSETRADATGIDARRGYARGFGPGRETVRGVGLDVVSVGDETGDAEGSDDGVQRKIRKGVVLELPRLRVAEPQDTAVAGGARHARAWET